MKTFGKPLTGDTWFSAKILNATRKRNGFRDTENYRDWGQLPHLDRTIEYDWDATPYNTQRGVGARIDLTVRDMLEASAELVGGYGRLFPLIMKLESENTAQLKSQNAELAKKLRNAEYKLRKLEKE